MNLIVNEFAVRIHFLTAGGGYVIWIRHRGIGAGYWILCAFRYFSFLPVSLAA